MAASHHLYLIRHLPTAGNLEKKYIGWTDESIKQLANAETHRLEGFDRQIVYGSDLLRAKQSADVFLPDAQFLPDMRFRECHFGEFEGKTYADLEKDKDYRNWLDDPLGNAPRGGERLAQVEQRFLEALGELPDGSIVVTHGGPIRIALTKFSPALQEFWSWQIPHGSLWKFEWRNHEELKEGIRCISLSEVPITGRERM